MIKTELRTHSCGELRSKDVKSEVTLTGWVHSRRDHGGIIFIDLRDRYGLTQVVFDPSHNEEAHKLADKLRREFVIQVTGKVRPRMEGMVNPKMDTGEIEIITDKLNILNEAATPPIEIDDRKIASEEMRLKYRYLDLRRETMQQRLKFRSLAAQSARKYLGSEGFLEIETPFLIKSTPEGARDYIVPSRVNPGCIYALPQSPQLYKQLLMVSGFDRYYQLPRCLRDEDLRADRQPEHTQIDLEMSFIGLEDLYRIAEGLISSLFKDCLGYPVPTPFKRIPYSEAMLKYGSDKPDIRFDLEIKDVSEVVKHSNFGVFHAAIDKGGFVRCLNAKGCANYSRKQIEALEEVGKIYKAKGLAWAKVKEGKLDSSIVKYFPEEVQEKLMDAVGAEEGDLLLFVADKEKVVCDALGHIRLELGKQLKLYNDKDFAFCFITDFPLYEWNDDEERWEMAHHMFCMPVEEHIKYFASNELGKIYCTQFDIVINGVEMASGSIRNNKPEVQEKIMNSIGFTKEEAERRFGFLLEAFKYGAPPHGGFAIGFDRIVAMMVGLTDIREVIAFPKNKAAACPMDGSPATASDAEIKESHIKWNYVKKEKKEGEKQ